MSRKSRAIKREKKRKSTTSRKKAARKAYYKSRAAHEKWVEKQERKWEKKAQDGRV